MREAGFPAKAASAGHGWPSVPGAMDGGKGPCRMAGGKRPVSRPAYESGLKPSLATTYAKAFAPCDVTLWGRGDGRGGRRSLGCGFSFPQGERKGTKDGSLRQIRPSLATIHAKASRRVISTIWGYRKEGERGDVCRFSYKKVVPN